MREIVEKDKCTGCMLCTNVCKKDSIQIVEENGYFYPYINTEKCVDCGICKSVCPQTKEARFNTTKHVFMGWTKNSEIRESSSSGGIFSMLAAQIISEGGVVVGAAYEDGCSRIKHIIIDDINDIGKLRLSKYVQSNTCDIWKKIKTIVASGQKLLFSGTPCQIDALYSLIDSSKENVFAIDLICRGVPSPVIWKEYTENLEQNWKSKIKEVNYRYKGKYKWTDRKVRIGFEDGQEYISTRADDPFAKLFFQNIVMRKTCFECKYSQPKRLGDITLGDFWAIKDDEKYDKDRGVSMILENTEKGNTLLNKISEKIEMKNMDHIDISLNNAGLGIKIKENPSAEQFWKDYKQYGFECVKKYI